MKLGLIGCGFMGEAVLKAALARGIAAPADIRVAEISEGRRADIQARHGVGCGADPAEAAAGADVIVLAVKPQEFGAAASALRGAVTEKQVIASIMAGVRVDAIAGATGAARIARVMPNTPAAIGEGASVWTATPALDDEDRARVRSLLAAMGAEVYVDGEKYLDAATALVGSGPGFVFLLVEAFIDAGVHVGLRRDVAETLALQVFAGSARYAQARGAHPAQLRNEVTSPAGTTAAGLQVLEEMGVRGAIMAAIEAACERSRELGEG